MLVVIGKLGAALLLASLLLGLPLRTPGSRRGSLAWLSHFSTLSEKTTLQDPLTQLLCACSLHSLRSCISCESHALSPPLVSLPETNTTKKDDYRALTPTLF